MELQKYAPGQARDDHGRFASGGVGGAGVSVLRPSTTSPIATAVRARILERDSSAIVRLRQSGEFDDENPEQLAEAIQAEEMANTDLLIREMASQLGFASERNLRAGVADAMREYVADGSVAVQMKADDYDRFMTTGKFKTLHDGGNPSGSDDVNMRLEMERSWFGPGLNPAYGFIRPSEDSDTSRMPDVEQYGSITLVLKPQVKARATVIAGDSLGYSSGPVPTSAVRPDEYGFDFNEFHGDFTDNRSEIKAAAREVLDRLQVDYVEAQIHGGLTPDDVEAVYSGGTKISKYAPGQARDNAGRFASGGVSVAGGQLGKVTFGQPKVTHNKITGGTMTAREGKTSFTTRDGEVFEFRVSHTRGTWVEDSTPVDYIQVTTGERSINNYAADAPAVTHGGYTVGFLDAQSDKWTPGSAAVIGMAEVVPEHQRKGIATAMLAAARQVHPVVHSDMLTGAGSAWSSVVKYSPGQARDSDGRWASGAGSVGAPEVNTASLGGPARKQAARAFAAIEKVHGSARVKKVILNQPGARELADMGNPKGWYHPVERNTINLSPKADALTIAHEYGHMLDAVEFGGATGDGWASTPVNPKWAKLRDVIHASPTSQAAAADSFSGWTDYKSYVRSDPETFARAYSQWVAVRSGDRAMLKAINASHTSDPLTQWTKGEFEPIAQAFDEFFAENSLLQNALVAKYAPGQARDNRGRFASGGGGSAGADLSVAVSAYDQRSGAVVQATLVDALTAIGEVHNVPGISRLEVVAVDRKTAAALLGQDDVLGWYTPAVSGKIYVNTDLDGDPLTTVVHEFGHMVDHEQLGIKLDADEGGGFGPHSSYQAGKADIANVVNTAYNSPSMKAYRESATPAMAAYVGSSSEVFARAYTQWVASRSSSQKLKDDLFTDIMRDPSEGWPDDEFEPIGLAMDELFRNRGLLNENVAKYAPGQPRDGQGRFSNSMVSVSSVKQIRMNGGKNALDTEHVAALTESMRAAGGFVGEPLQIEVMGNGTELLTDGHHRLAAAEAAGLTEVPVRVYADTPEGRAAATSAIVAAEARKIQKYAPGQPRDAEGQFASVGGFVGRAAKVAATVHSFKDVSAPTVVETTELAEKVGGDYQMSTKQIRIKPDGLTPELTYLHEVGHHLDNTVFRNGSGLVGRQKMGPASGLMKAIKNSPEFKDWTYWPDGRYYASGSETFARGYAQWIATRSGDESLLAQVASRNDMWTPETFEPVAAAYDTLFSSKGLIE